jgi:protein phosphatase 1 regulatory subunit 11
MTSAIQTRPSTSAPSDGSRTITIHVQSRPEGDVSGSPPSSQPPIGALRLRGGPRGTSRQRVAWDEDVIDNEGAGKKKSKSKHTCNFS